MSQWMNGKTGPREYVFVISIKVYVAATNTNWIIAAEIHFSESLMREH